MAEATVESIFGTKAGIIWNALNENGPSSIGNLLKTTSLSREEICGALGWLGRENKIVVEMQRRAMIFSLRESERRWQAVKGTPTGSSVTQEETTYHPSMSPENAAEARKAKAPTINAKAVKRALAFILSEFEANREPTPTQVSNAAGMDSRQLGKALSKLNIKSETVYREGKNVKIYPLALRARVWELAALDVDGLQKMVESRARAMEDDRERNQERYTVFD
ncbi:MAG: winged helix-turn-helix domain-containing protein [Methanothrix sp.]|nr:winged helix-turn-helix domain-containing protein [Methanothrix sp.]